MPYKDRPDQIQVNDPVSLDPPRTFTPGYNPLGGRKMFHPTDQQRREVETLSGYGVPIEIQCKAMGISKPTFLREFDREISKGRLLAAGAVTQNIHRQAVKDSAKAYPFAALYAKTQLGWKETDVVEVTPKPAAQFDMSLLSDDDLADIARLKQKLLPPPSAEEPQDKTETHIDQGSPPD